MAQDQNSILNSVKKVLGFDEDYKAFDVDIIMHINTAFATLQSLGVGPEGGFMIEDEKATWKDYQGEDMQMNSVRSYVYIKTRILFDPPGAGYTLTSFENLAKEIEWRLHVHAEGAL